MIKIKGFDERVEYINRIMEEENVSYDEAVNIIKEQDERDKMMEEEFEREEAECDKFTKAMDLLVETMDKFNCSREEAIKIINSSNYNPFK